jgi:outer membrane receptor for ferrienterochelin and colicins
MKNRLRSAVVALLAPFCFSEGIAQGQPDLAAATVPAVAGGGKPNSLFDMALDQVLDIEVSTASKLKTEKKKSPGNLTVITQDQIQRYGYRTVGEAIQRVSGFLVSNLGVGTFLGFRGLSPQGTTGNARILLLIDGVRFNDWNFDSVILNEDFPLDILSVERIEVLKGAGSAIWGTNALYAVINVISKTGDSARASQTLAETASNGRTKGYASWGEKTSGGLSYFSSISTTSEFGDTAAFYPAFADTDGSNGIAREIYEQKNHRANLKLSYGNFYSNVVYGYSDSLIGSGVDFLFDDGGTSDYHLIPARAEIGYKFDVWEEKEGELLLRNYYTLDRSRNIFRYPASTAGNTTQVYNRYTTQASGTELRYSQNITDNFKGIVGTEWLRVFENRFFQSEGEYTPSDEQISFDSSGEAPHLTATSYFYDIMYSPTEEVSVFFGGRLDRFSGLRSAFGPRASVVINPNEVTTARFMYSQGLRNPAIGERSTPAASSKAVDHETLNFYEAMLERRFEGGITTSGSVFYNDLSNTVDFAEFEDGNQTYKNGPGFSSRGIELQATAQLAEDIQAYGNLTYAEGRDKNTDRAIKSFPHTLARLGASFGEKQGAILVTPEFIFGSGTEGETGKEFNPFMLVNLTLVSYPVGNGLNLSASAYNIFNKDYVRLVGSRPDNADSERAVEAGRTFRLQAAWDF